MSVGSKVVVCATATGKLRPGFVRGYSCLVCGKEIQASPDAQAQIRAGFEPLCNECGVELMRKAKLAGTMPAAVIKNPGLTAKDMDGFTAQINEGIPEYLQRDIVKCDFCSIEKSPFDMWVYPVDEFLLVHPGTELLHAKKGEWSACELCHQFISKDEWGGLLNWLIEGSSLALSGDESKDRAWLSALHQQIRKHISGPPFQRYLTKTKNF